MKSVKKSFRKTEFALLIVGLLIVILFYLYSLTSVLSTKICPHEGGESVSYSLTTTNRMLVVHASDRRSASRKGGFPETKISEINLGDSLKYSLLGYILGFFAFTISYELFFLLEPNPKTRKWGYLLLTNLKLVIIGGLFYYVRLTGIPATSLVIGFIVCETLAVFVLLFNAYRSNNLLKVSKAKTDSSY